MIKNTLNTWIRRTALAAVLLSIPTLARAATIELIPSDTIVNVGDVFDIDLVAIAIQLGAYDFLIAYNPLLVSIDPALVAFDTHLGGPDASLPSVTPGLDSLELAEVSFLTNASVLAALQSGPSYPLAHVKAKVLKAGTITFEFVSTPFTSATDYNGVPIGGVVYAGTSVMATGSIPPDPPTVPEPSSGALLSAGLGLLVASRLRR